MKGKSMNKKQKRGFTLAETLITLAIIGVVAALTLPTMIANHQKKVYVVQLQKAISTLEQGFKMMMADDAVDSLSYTTIFSSLSAGGEYHELCLTTYEYSTEVCQQFLEAWKDYFNISEISTNHYTELKYLDGSGYEEVDDYYFIKLSDGTYITSNMLSDDANLSGTIPFGRKEWTKILGTIEVDVNGEKGPNTGGRDVFNFFVLEDGTLAGLGDGTREECTSQSEKSMANFVGEYCTSYLMNNGWVMDY